MKLIHLAIIAAFIFSNSPLLASTEKLTKKDWVKISEQRKIYFVMGKMEEYQTKGRVLSKSAHDYIAILDKKAAHNPNLSDQDMDSIFADIV